MKFTLLSLLLFAYSITSYSRVLANDGIIHDRLHKTITINSQNGDLKMVIDYSGGCYIRSLSVKGVNRLSSSGAFTGYTQDMTSYTSKALLSTPAVFVSKNKAQISNIRYGGSDTSLTETWDFTLTDNAIDWKLTRAYPKGYRLEDIAFPAWNFASLQTWKGGIIDNGGVVWCKYLNTINDTYGVHTGGTTYWNEITGDALSIQGKAFNGNHIATKFSHSPQGEFTSTQLVTTEVLKQRHNLSRFVYAKHDVFAPTSVQKGTITAHYKIRYVDYFKEYDRGNLANIDASAVRELMNTTARYGVVDNNIVGGNGWITNWKCLHEPFFAQIALAVSDSNYTNNLINTLDQERDLAMLPDGRVLSRWHDVKGDEIEGTYNDTTGYYEAKWGYTIDSQTGYVINVSDLFNLTGNLKWLKSHQTSCRKALDWLIQRDSNHNGIFEMKNNDISEAKCSDWIDIVWASFENGFVNAQLYDALVKWAACEKILGNTTEAEKYTTIALNLKKAFNKPVEQGGFWDEAKKQFVYWRDADGSVHGDNLVTPVQFFAIASGLCDDETRIHSILQQIENRTSAEKLFHWPLVFESFRREEVSDGNWPFPKYENGDIFPTWGYIGVKSYTKYDKELALKYVTNLLAQYKKDGLSSQRYSRTTQEGLGTDILSGICTGITALYSDIYGVQPRWNRLVLAPNITASLYGTQFNYYLRGETYAIELSENSNKISTPFYTACFPHTFGIRGSKGEVIFYPGDQDKVSLDISADADKKIDIRIDTFSEKSVSFSIKGKGVYQIALNGFPSNKSIRIVINGTEKTITLNKNGYAILKHIQ